MARVWAVPASEVIESVSLSLLGLEDVLGGLGLSLRDGLLAFSPFFLDAKDPSSLLFIIGERLTLKGFSMDSSPAMTLPSFSLSGRVTCLGLTVISSITKSYFLTSDIASSVSNLDMWS